MIASKSTPEDPGLFMGVSLAMPPRTILGCWINHSHDVTTRQLPFVGRCAGLRSVNLIP